MKVLFANIPFIRYDEHGQIRTGPNAGSRWPFTCPGITSYACFPFWMAYAVSYLRSHGVDAKFYDGVALKHWDHDLVRGAIDKIRPDVLFLETSTPLFNTIKEFAFWAKESFGSRVVLVGPHMYTYSDSLIGETFVDNCVIGEYEKAALDIVLKGKRSKPIYVFDHLDDIDFVNGENFLPFRPMAYLFNYWDASMRTPRGQLQVMTSRGCPFKCTYCQWPRVMNNERYRARKPALVVDEIKTVVREYRRHWRALPLLHRVREVAPVTYGNLRTRAKRLLMPTAGKITLDSKFEIKSIFFDDDTWNLGEKRVTGLCRGLKEIGLPWTMMGRIDVSPSELYDLMVDSGCVGMRFGVESFNQRLLDNTRKNLDARKSYQNIKYLLTRFSGLEFHFTTMQNLPGQTKGDRENDLRILEELKAIGERADNVVHWQTSDCIAFPGTALWDELIAAGKEELLRDFELFDGSPANSEKLAHVVGWLGSEYRNNGQVRR